MKKLELFAGTIFSVFRVKGDAYFLRKEKDWDLLEKKKNLFLLREGGKEEKFMLFSGPTY